MDKKDDTAGFAHDVERRSFLKGAPFGGLAVAATLAGVKTPVAAAQEAKSSTVPPVPAQAMEVSAAAPDPRPAGHGSDYMVDVLRGIGIKAFAAVPGSTFAGIQESVINYGMLTDPPTPWFTSTHEELSVAFAHGYAKVTGEPMACVVHSVVGLQHAAMALYNAYCDRAPVFTVTGSLTNPAAREGFVDWYHAVDDGPGLVRDFVKYDATPRSLEQFAEVAQRAYRFSLTPPYGPVVIAVDLDLQEAPLPADRRLPVPSRPLISPSQGDTGAVLEAARLLAQASAPVIVADRAARTPAGLQQIVALAEALNAAVIDMQGRMNFPWRHPLNQTSRSRAALAAADVVLGLELADFKGQTAGAKVAKKITINAGDVYFRSNYQAFEAFAAPDVLIEGDSEATLPALVEAVKVELGKRGKSGLDDRGRALAEAHAAALRASRAAAAVGWNDRPITTARLFAELYDQVRSLDWCLMTGCHFQNFWAQQLWDAKQHWQFIGDSGAYGLGYVPGAAVGAAYAHQPHGRLPIAIGGDGDLLMAPGGLWTAAYHKIPVLYIVHNNGGFHQELMKVQMQANRRDRGITRTVIGTELPGVDYAQIAKGMGCYGDRVTEPSELRDAIARALSVVRNGEPALLDVVLQGR